MFRKVVGLALVLCLSGVVAAQDKDKGKDKDKAKDKPAKTKAEVVKADVKGMMLSVKIDGKAQDFKVTKDVAVIGPFGGKTTFKDDRLQTPNLMVGLVLDKDGKTLKEIHLPVIRKAKDKDKSAKDKDKDKKDK